MNVSHLATDFETVVDGLESVRLRFPAGDPGHGPDQTIPSALVRPITTREQQVSNGKYQSGDVRIMLPASKCQRVPTPGCVIFGPSDDAEYTVLDVAQQALRAVYTCTARNLVVVHRLDSLITVQQATYAKGLGGAETPTWEDLHTDVRARIQPLGGQEGQQHGRRALLRRFTVYVREPFVLRRQHRILDSAGNVYRVTGFDNPERIDRLTEISCEEFRDGD